MRPANYDPNLSVEKLLMEQTSVINHLRNYVAAAHEVNRLNDVVIPALKAALDEAATTIQSVKWDVETGEAVDQSPACIAQDQGCRCSIS